MNKAKAELPIYFLHIPKAAGTTFNDILYSNFRFKEIAKIDGTHPEESIDKLVQLNSATARNYKLVMGHMRYGLHTRFGHNSTYLTMLREPVSRVRSLYNYIITTVQHPLYNQFSKEGVSFEAFLSGALTDEMSNDQVRRIAGVYDSEIKPEHLSIAKQNITDKFSFIGISERFDESMLLLQACSGKFNKINYMRQNVGKIREKSELTGKDKEAIVEKNKLDISLYKYCYELFENKLAECEIDNTKLLRYREENSRYQKRATRYLPLIQVAKKIKRKSFLLHEGLKNG